MPLKKEPCRNFQRGSCHFGDKCKFLHVTQQQPKQNAFGFGTQTGMPFQQTNSQQQKPNPFGFGIQNSGSAIGASNAGGPKQSNGFKPFENKWVRSEQPANQSQTGSHHSCTDPDSCKRLIVEDFQQERPLWKLTCYGHYKHLPCDITGDVSCEELRAAAYDEAKRGVNLQSIVERERNLLNSKLMEFENLRQNPYTKQPHLSQPNQNPFPAVGPSLNSQIAQSPGPPVSSLGPQGSTPNMAFGVKTSVPFNNAFGQFQGSPGPFGTINLPSGPFGGQGPAQMGGSFFTSNVAGFGNSSMSNHSSQVSPVRTGGNPFASIVAGFGNSVITSQGNQLPSTSSIFPKIQTSAINQSPMFSNGFGSTNSVEPVSTITEPISKIPSEVSAADASIWLKEEWKLGEIPEQPPPDSFCRV